ncbi:MAG: DUF4395 domain-containing protein [Bacteroidetes bacterium]|nr:MAG: DUF4395 domain-containing protein [Bacteroidota bacterium]
MKTSAQFGDMVDGYSVPVLNEREIRASAGILFLGAFLSLMFIIFQGNFVAAKYFVIIFLLDFIIRLHITPRQAPTLILGRWIVRNQLPEFVGAAQKQFAWKIGLLLASLMFVLLIVLNTYSFLTGLICLICLLFLFFESVFGICLGCIVYKRFYPEEAKYCPGESCELNDQHETQKIKRSQWTTFFVFVFGMTLLLYALSGIIGLRPENLWEFLF